MTLELRLATTNELSRAELTALRALLDEAFEGDFSAHDWEHCLGGVHVIATAGGGPISHAGVIDRVLVAGDRPLQTGYVEGVGTQPRLQGRGYGTKVMEAVNGIISARYQLGGLGTGNLGFYERLGWVLWQGPTGVKTPTGVKWTPEEDGAVMVLRTTSTNNLDLSAPLLCDWRAGDVW